MENSNSSLNTTNSCSLPKIVVLRWGHRVQRDVRLTTHVALTARALGACSFILADTADRHIEETVTKITQAWGGNFKFDMAVPWKRAVQEWKKHGGIIVHLTAYGENIQTSDVLSRIKAQNKEVMLLVGSQKVPGEFYSEEISDFNVAVGNQPHSECSALALFLDRYFEGQELDQRFEKAKISIVPKERGKEIKTNNVEF
ncbi:tRNA (cytidine(56)-2'-O)-methyltransferase [Candidatus Bathycorpusculum sp.]|uniref:tRNA (cytidine(56)-2'-O)-methyltransferase n=1 Tax=Candidatus Bathycorpusculum sp. TaxID=2994959 RepID=UPI00281DA8C8|nr:tRNA (cytidine(56)-2'-O)-methyltransferase [Candidatus Termitimicrobium sp.]MCL2431225.1 tRNA (cytidine(56)-2'-O)-methyltransferase [Candidatus Termitimicrobium sp.]